jgi:hypothetical protein
VIRLIGKSHRKKVECFSLGLAERLHVVTICESFIGLAGLFCDNSILIFF